LAWLRDRGAIQQCLRLVGDLRGLWFHRGSWSEGWAQLEEALTLPGADLPTAARAHALATAAVVAIWRGDAAGAIPLNAEALAIVEALGERDQQPWLLVSQGIAVARLGDSDDAIQYWERGYALAREVGDGVNAARSLANISGVSAGRLDLDHRQALSEKALALARAAGHPATIHLCLTGLCNIALDRGAYHQAATAFQETLAICASSNWQWQVAEQLFGIAKLAHATGLYSGATQLLAATDAHRERTGMPLAQAYLALHDQLLADLRATMAGDSYAAAWTAGHGMPLAEAVAVAMNVLAVIDAADSLPIAPQLAANHDLSPRELEVLRLIAIGQSNREIAEALYLSPRTVERHIANVYLKIDVHSRAEATAYAQRHHLV
jgi:DNA-binding CsgD family transcriptional regulator